MLQDRRLHAAMKIVLPDAARGADASIRNLYDSPGWHDHIVRGYGRTTTDPADLLDPTFATENDGRNIVLSMCADAFVPWVDKQTHSITPFMCMVLNLPENVRHKFAQMILVGIIPGPHKPTNFQAYLKVVVDELLRLYTDGFGYTDGDGKQCRSRVKLLMTCCDYPGHADMNEQQSSGSQGCMKCLIKVRSARNRM